MPQTTRLPSVFYSEPGQAKTNVSTETCRKIFEETGGVISDNNGATWRLCAKSAGAGYKTMWLDPVNSITDFNEDPPKCSTCKMVDALVTSTLAQLSGDIPEGAAGRDLAFGKLERAIGAFTAIRDWVGRSLKK